MPAQAVAGPFDVNHNGMMQQPIKLGGGHHGVAEDLSPLGKAAVGGEDHGAIFVAGIDQLEEQVGTACRD